MKEQKNARAPWEEPFEIQEFPLLIIMPLFMMATLLVVIVYKRKNMHLKAPSL